MKSTTLPSGAGPDPDSPGTVENIQALRGIAALLVVWGHLKFGLAPLCPGAGDIPLVHSGRGAMGVDIFFIISGFVISLTACKRHHRPLDFLLARLARVSPLYLAAFLPAYLIKMNIGTHLTWKSAWNGIFYLPVFDWADYTEPPVGVGWTLSFEMWFYVAFAGLLIFSKPSHVPLILAAIFFVMSPIMTTFYQAGWYFPRFLFHPFVLEFAFGCLIYHAQRWLRGWIAWALIAIGFAITLSFTAYTGYLGWQVNVLSAHLDQAWLRVLLWGVPSALVIAGLVGLERHHGLQLPRALVWLGTISYSLYLTHRFTLALVDKIGARVGLHQPLLATLVIFPSCLLVGWLCWRWVETPLTTWAKKWAKRLAGGSRRGSNPLKPMTHAV